MVRVLCAAAAAVAGRARVVDDQAAALAVAARLGEGEPAQVAAGCPVPSQVGQTRGVVPALAPVPAQAGTAPSLVRRSGTVTPVDGLGEAERDLGLDVARRAAGA